MRRRQKDRFIELLKDPEYRHGFFTDLVNGSIASQIKIIRERRGYTQQKLAELAGMKQSRISAMEDVNYGSWSIRSLRRLAEALDVALSVRFVAFSKALEEYGSFSSRALFVPPFDDDPGLLPVSEEANTVAGMLAKGRTSDFESLPRIGLKTETTIGVQ